MATKKKTKGKLPWHSAFFAGIQIEFEKEAEKLIFENEHQLGTDPMRIDILIIKKHTEEQIPGTDENTKLTNVRKGIVKAVPFCNKVINQRYTYQRMQGVHPNRNIPYRNALTEGGQKYSKLTCRKTQSQEICKVYSQS